MSSSAYDFIKLDVRINQMREAHKLAVGSSYSELTTLSGSLHIDLEVQFSVLIMLAIIDVSDLAIVVSKRLLRSGV